MISDENLAVIHAYLCADGYVTTNKPGQKKRYVIGLRNKNLTLLEDFQNKFYNFFKIEPHLYPNERCQIGSKKIYYNLTNNFGSFYSREWLMPKLERSLINIWLRTFFDCEGWVFCKKHQNRHIGVDSINERGLDQIKKELESIGIKIIKREIKKRKIFRLLIYGKENISLFRERVGFLHPAKKQKLDETVADFVDYRWNLKNESDVKKVMAERTKIKKPYIVRIISRDKENLENLAGRIFDLFNIKISNINARINGIGTKYYELSINRKLEVQKIVYHKLINPAELTKITIR